MSVRSCRLCATPLNAPAMLTLAGMPKSAQFFPSAASVQDDAPMDLTVVECRACGLVQLDNDPVAYFREVIRASAFSSEMAAFRLEQFARFSQRFALQGRTVLEVGCGRGEYLALLNQQGMNACGVEFGEQAVAACRQAGWQVERTFIADSRQELSGAPFAAFFSFNFLEHAPEPLTILKGIAANLEQGAVGLVEVPNFDMMRRENQVTEFISDHLSYFTRDTLSLLLGLAGFEVLECSEIWHDYILSAVVRKRRPMASGGFDDARARLSAQLHAYADRFGQDGVAVWGAGHQALAVLALTDLAGKIKYVVDSAPFKQNKLTPATHLPIVAPEVFFQDELSALIVMAAAYSDEVAATVKSRCANPPALAILRADGLQEL